MPKDKTNKKEKKETATRRILAFIREDHKFENWLLLALAIILLVISVYILIAAASNKNSFADTYFDISKSGWSIFNAKWKVILTASIITALALGVIVYCLVPVYKPVFQDAKLISWCEKKTLFLNSVTVLVFIAFFTGLFYAFDFALIPLFKLIFRS